MADVRRPEEPSRVGLDQRLLEPERSGQPGRSPVVMVSIRRCDELAGADEPACLTVAQALGRLG
jgi:hypothetical protein